MTIFKSVKDMENFSNAAHTAIKLGGIAKIISNPTPLGVGTAVANAVSEKMTGKSLAEHVLTAAQNQANLPPNPNSNKGQSNPALAEQKMIRGAAVQDLEKLSSANPNIARGDFDRTARAKGGKISYKSISDMERGR